MKYRTLGRTGFSVSEIGLGGEYLEGKDPERVNDVISAALDNGVNIIDCFMPNPEVRFNIGRALKKRREKVYIQGHFRSVWKDNQYGRTLDISEVKYFFDDILSRMQTDYLDIGTIHMIDKDSDYDAIFNGPIIEYAMGLKEKGIIRALGVSTHNPVNALKAARSGLVDTVLFSINPVYDVMGENEERPRKIDSTLFADRTVLNGINSVREEFYKYCSNNGIGITVMKALGAGALLSARTSPFGMALTSSQCIHYALTRPGVCSVLLGMESVEQVEDAIKYEEMSDEEKDYSFIFANTPKFSSLGRCMYCNHCLPCPVHIDIAQIGKYLDMALLDGHPSPSLQAHYDSLEHLASECLYCGNCETQCPFGVKIMERMRAAESMFE